MSTLPSFMVLASNQVPFTTPKYATYTEGKYSDSISEKSLPGLQEFAETNIWSPKVKLAVEPSATGNGRLVHIRSCYNNKYWVSHTFNRIPGIYVAALGDKPEEDQSKVTCTLFEYIFVGDNRIQLRHSQNQMFLRFDKPYIRHIHNGIGYQALTLDGSRVPDISDPFQNFSFIDWEKLVILPSRVSFKSEDGRYIRSHSQDGLNYQTLFAADVGNPEVGKELFRTSDGKYRIKDLYYGRFWRLSPNWIWADADESNTSDDTLFTVEKLGDNVVALRNVRNNNFVGPLTVDCKTDCLNAHYPQLSKEVMLIVE